MLARNEGLERELGTIIQGLGIACGSGNGKEQGNYYGIGNRWGYYTDSWILY